MVFSSSSTSNSNFSGGGGPLGAIVVAVGAIGLVGWSMADLFALSAVLFAAIGGYLLLVVLVYLWVDRNMSIHRERVKFCLIVSALAAASLDILVFRTGFTPFIVVDGVVAAFFVLALVGGLLAALPWLGKVLAIAVAVLLIAAPFSEPVKANERWQVIVEVRERRCDPLANADVQCHVVAAADANVALGPVQFATSDANGDARFTFSGNSLGKAAFCEASRQAQNGEEAYLPYSVVARPALFGITYANIMLLHEGETSPYISGERSCGPSR